MADMSTAGAPGGGPSPAARRSRVAGLVPACLLLAWAMPCAAEWQTFRASDGLPSNSVFSMLEDRSGNLWFGTNGGVSRFDGINWKTYANTDGLAVGSTYAILQDHSGNLWFGTYYGVIRFDGVTWKSYTTADGLAGKSVYSILEDRSGNLWFATDGAVSRFDGAPTLSSRRSPSQAATRFSKRQARPREPRRSPRSC
jgi:streptogramin lyase